MSQVQTIAIIAERLQELKAKIDPSLWADTPLPIIAGPKWWLDAVVEEFGGESGEEPGEIHGCQVVRRDNIDEPVLIDHDGKVYKIMPGVKDAVQQVTGSGNVH